MVLSPPRFLAGPELEELSGAEAAESMVSVT
jgi:hypothetical protein